MISYRHKRGFTLVELIIVIAFVSIIISTAGSMMVFSIRSQDVIEKEFQIQADMRLASEVVNQQVRYASAVFLLNSNQYTGSADLKEGWNYFVLSDDKSEIVHYSWNEISGTHDVSQLVKARDGVFYGLRFEGVHDKSQVVKYQLDGHFTDGGNVKVSIKSELNALNSVVVDDSGVGVLPSVSMAYRSEDIPDADKIKVAVTLVLDRSGSMGGIMGGTNNDIRLAVMKAKASELIDTFASMDNVYVSLIPFSTNANNPGAFLLAKDHKDALKTSISGYVANGGTNAGDGLRRSYYNHVTFNAGELDKVLNYTILLMDGNPTFWPSLDGSTHYYGLGDISSTFSVLGGDGQETTASINGSLDYISAFSNGYIKNISHTQTVFMKTFVIGFTAVPEQVNRANTIATYHTHAYDNRIKGFYYAATSSEELANVFASITEYILQDTWHIYGPTE